MTGALSVRVPSDAEMAAIDAHLATVRIVIPGIVDDVTGAPRTTTALAELQAWCRRLARSRAARGEAPLSRPQLYGLVMGLHGALVPHASPQGIVWRAMLRAAGQFAEGQVAPVEAQEDRSPDPSTPEQWMIKRAKEHLAETGKKLPRDEGVKACMDALKCGVRDAGSAYTALPAELKFSRGEPHG